jgi:hypothetical protein
MNNPTTPTTSPDNIFNMKQQTSFPAQSPASTATQPKMPHAAKGVSAIAPQKTNKNKQRI